MSPERDGLEARVPGGKEFRRHDGNNPEHPRFSCDDPSECANNNGGIDKTQTATQIQHFAGLCGGKNLLVGPASQPNLIAGQSYVIKGLSVNEHCQFL